jgi:Immunoglobulin-like domain of bacterial spore germination
MRLIRRHDKAARVTGHPAGSLRGVMKGLRAWVVGIVAVIGLSGCGGDNSTTFVLPSGSSSSPTASATATAAAGLTGSPASSSLPTTAATPIAGNLKIIIDSPDSSSPISSPVAISGTASVDKGTVVAVVLDASGAELGRGTATASASKPDFGHFDVTVSFSGATSGAKGQIKVFGVSPRDGTTPTNYYFISVRFA